MNKQLKILWTSSPTQIYQQKLQCQSHAGSPNDRVPYFWCENQSGMNEEGLSGDIWMSSAEENKLGMISAEKCFETGKKQED